MIEKDDKNTECTLNFRVTKEFRWRYKYYATENEVMMNWVLHRSFEVYRGLVKLGVFDAAAERDLLRARHRSAKK